MRWPRLPLLHYLLIGGALFAFDRRWREPAPTASPTPPRPVALISAAQQREMRDRFMRDTGMRPTVADEQALLRREIDNELLYREALALGLDRGDRSIRWQLVEKMSFIEGVDESEVDADALYRQAKGLGFDRDDPVIRRMLVEKMRLLVKASAASTPIDDATLFAYLAAHADRFRLPARITFRHVFFSRERRGTRARDDAEALLAQIGQRARPAAVGDAIALHGDAFPRGQVIRAHSPAQIAATFGEPFASAVARQAVGSWSVQASAHGVHLVRVDEVTAGALPSLDTVRNRVAAEIVAERGEVAVARFVEQLRARSVIRVDAPEDEAT